MNSTDNASTTHKILRLRDGQQHSIDDSLAVEEPLEIRLWYTDSIKGRQHRSLSITMRTPGHDDLLALGFLFSEGILNSPDQVQAVEQINDNVIKVTVHEAITLDLSRLERHFYTTSSCGICGKASLEALSLSGAEAVIDEEQLQLTSSQLMALPDRLREQQALFSLSGGNHGVGLFDKQGQILACFEDVGRHNAMDKLIGHCFQQASLPLQDKGIIVSGRASFELMQKALMAGCPMLVAVGAPSSLAVELAEEFNITLTGFTGRHGYNIYNAPSRIREDFLESETPER